MTERRSRRVSATVREGPKIESRSGKDLKEAVHEMFSCCDSETSCNHRKSLSAKISASWTKVSEIPSHMMPYAMEEAVSVDDVPKPGHQRRRSSISVLSAPGGAHTEDYENLDDFQRAVRCLKSDYKTFAASNFDRFIKEDEDRALKEVWPALEHELRITAMLPDDIFGEVYPAPISSFAENFHEPASKKLPIAIIELYQTGNEKGARQLLALVFDFVGVDNSEISAYWSNCLEKLVESCRSVNVQKDIYPIIVDRMATKASSINGKIAASRILRKLATRFNYEVIQKKIFPLMDAIARDKDPMVRSHAISCLPEMIHRIKNKEPVLKLINFVSQDSDPVVRAAITSTIVQSVTLMSPNEPRNKAYFESVMRTIKTLVKDAYVKANVDLLVSFSACMGRCCMVFSMAGVLQPRDTLWYLDAFLQLSRYQANSVTGLDGKDENEEDRMPAGFANFRANMEFNRRHSIVEALISTKVTNPVERESKQANTAKAIAVLRSNAEGRRLSIPYGGAINPSQCLKQFGPDLEKAHECRANAAKEFFDFMMFAQPIVDFRYGLHPLVVDLMHDSRPEVRAAMAEKILAIMEYLGPEAGLLHGELVYGLSDDDLDVIQAIVPSLSRILKCLVQAKVLSPDCVTPKLVEIGGAILFCEERLNQSTYYSVHQIMLEQLCALPFCMPGDYIYSNFVPSLFHRLRHMRQIPCRLAAANSIVTFLRHCRRAIHREDIRKRIREGFAQGRSVHDRMLFLYMAKKIMEMFSRKYFRDHFFEDVLQLANDPIVNVRRKVIELVPEIKNAADEPSYQRKLEDTLKTARKSEVDRDVKTVMESVIAKVGNKSALDQLDAGTGKGSIAPLMIYQKVKDPNDEAKELEENQIASLEHKVTMEDISTKNVQDKRKSFYGTTKKYE